MRAHHRKCSPRIGRRHRRLAQRRGVRAGHRPWRRLTKSENEGLTLRTHIERRCVWNEIHTLWPHAIGKFLRQIQCTLCHLRLQLLAFDGAVKTLLFGANAFGHGYSSSRILL